jgi:hypothetical protein
VGNHAVSYRGCMNWKEAKTALAKNAPDGYQIAPQLFPLPLRKSSGPGPCQTDGPGRVVESRRPRKRVVKATIPSHTIQIHTSQPVTETSVQPKVTVIRWRGLRRLRTKPQQTLSLVLGSPRRKQPRVSKQRPLNPQLPTWWYQTNFPLPRLRKVVISITFATMHVWS